MSHSSAPGGARCGRRAWSTTSCISESEPSVNTKNRFPPCPVIACPPSTRSDGAYAMRRSGAGQRTADAPVARRRRVTLVGKSSTASGTRQLSPTGEASSEPRRSQSLPLSSHSSARPSSRHGAALDGDAETKNCCHGLVRDTGKHRSQRVLVEPDGQSAAKPSSILHATSELVEMKFAARKVSFVADAAVRARMSASGMFRASGSVPPATSAPSGTPSPSVSGRPGSVP